MSSSSASTTETVRRKAASRYLGSSLVEREPIVQQRNLSVENIVRIGQPVFKIEEEDIEFGNMDAHYSFTNSNNVAEHGNSFSRKFGLNILNIIDINYNKKEQNKDVRKEQGTVVSVVCSQIVSIREKDFRNLKKISGNVDSHNLGVTYISSGNLLFGFHLIIKETSLSSTYDKRVTIGGKVDVGACIEKIVGKALKLELNGEQEAILDEKREKSSVFSVEIEGIGGYVWEGQKSIPNKEELRDYIRAIHEDFYKKLPELPGAFFCDISSQKNTTQEVSFSIEDAGKIHYLCRDGDRLYWGKQFAPTSFSVSPADYFMPPNKPIWDQFVSISTEDGKHLKISSGHMFTDLSLSQKRETKWHFRPTEDRSQCFLAGEFSGNEWTLKKLSRGSIAELCPGKDEENRQSIHFKVKLSKLGLNVENTVTNPTFISEKVSEERPKLQISEKFSEQEAIIIHDFKHRVFPKLKAARNQSVVMLVGNLGAGKSCLINALLGHSFTKGKTIDGKSFFEVVNPVQPYSKMGSSAYSVTSEVNVFPISRNKVTLALSDNPGYDPEEEIKKRERAKEEKKRKQYQEDKKGNGKERKKENEVEEENKKEYDAIYMGRFLTKEFSKEIKSVVVVINLDDLGSTRAFSLKQLMYSLLELFHSDSFEYIKRGIIFVVNFKGNPPEVGKTHEDIVLEKLHGLKKEWEKSRNIIRQLPEIISEEVEEGKIETASEYLCIAFYKGISKGIELAGKGMAFAKEVVTHLGLSAANASKEAIEDKLERCEIEAEALSLLEIITKDNLIVWKSIDDSIAIQNTYAKIDESIPFPGIYLKYGFHDTAVKNYYDLFNRHIESCLFLCDLDKEFLVCERQINEDNISISLSKKSLDGEREELLEGYRQDLKDKKELLEQKEKELEIYKATPVALQTISMPYARYKGWFIFGQKCPRSTYTYTGKIPCTHIVEINSNAKLFLMRDLNKEPLNRGELYFQKEGNKLKYKAMSPQGKMVEGTINVKIKSELTIEVLARHRREILEKLHKAGASYADISLFKIKIYPDLSDQPTKNHDGTIISDKPKIEVEKDKWWSTIYDGEVKITLGTIIEYHDAYIEEIKSKNEEIERIRHDVNFLKNAIREVPTKESLETTIQQCKENIAAVEIKKKEIFQKIESKRLDYEQEYSVWEPIADVMKKAEGSIGTANVNPYPSITKFLQLAEKYYGCHPNDSEKEIQDHLKEIDKSECKAEPEELPMADFIDDNLAKTEMSKKLPGGNRTTSSDFFSVSSSSSSSPLNRTNGDAQFMFIQTTTLHRKQNLSDSSSLSIKMTEANETAKTPPPSHSSNSKASKACVSSEVSDLSPSSSMNTPYGVNDMTSPMSPLSVVTPLILEEATLSEERESLSIPTSTSIVARDNSPFDAMLLISSNRYASFTVLPSESKGSEEIEKKADSACSCLIL